MGALEAWPAISRSQHWTGLPQFTLIWSKKEGDMMADAADQAMMLVLTRFGTRLRTTSAPGCMTFGASSSRSAGLRASEGEKRGDLNYRSGSRLRCYCQ